MVTQRHWLLQVIEIGNLEELKFRVEQETQHWNNMVLQTANLQNAKLWA